MNFDEQLTLIRESARYELFNNLIPYWFDHTMDEKQGGFFGRINHDNLPEKDAPKGVILNTRILWTFSSVHRQFDSMESEILAKRACDYVQDQFLDESQGGVYWLLNADGTVRDDRKHMYAQGFAVYAFSEYFGAFGDEKALRLAKEIFNLMEKHGYDDEFGGYYECFSRDWKLLDDVRLSEKDINEPKSMNTHLHVLEGYTNLYRYWPDEQLKSAIKKLIHVFTDHIIDDEKYSLVKFMDVDWTPKTFDKSFGHDIEASWLIMEAAEVIDDEDLTTSLRKKMLKMADAVLENGMNEDGSLINEMHADGSVDKVRDYWPQAEGAVGFLQAFEFTHESNYLNAAKGLWDYITSRMVDREHGEWHECVDEHGVPLQIDKIREWKGPYHGGRACMEIMNRCEKLSDVQNPVTADDMSRIN